MEREILSITPYRYQYVVDNDGQPLWGCVVEYINSQGKKTKIGFDKLDELGTLVAFLEHCKKLDRRKK